MQHWLKIELDETGALAARQFCSTDYGPRNKRRPITVTREVALDDDVAATLRTAMNKVMDANREPLERQMRKARPAAELAAEQRNEFDGE